MTSSRGVTMRDIAATSGVSVATVSLALRGAPGVGEETRARVHAAAQELGYRANRAASLMKLHRTRVLGVTMDPRAAFHADLAAAIQEAADASGYELVPALLTAAHGERRAVDSLVGLRCEALVLLGSELSTSELRALATRVPVVLVGRRDPAVDAVRSADQRGQRLLVEHLLGLGHRAVAYVDGGTHPVAVDRRRGYRDAMRRAGLAEHAVVVRGGSTEDDGRRAMEKLLLGARIPSAICAFNDHVALGVLDVLRGRGIAVPGEVSVTGYDNTAFARLGAIDLTTVDQHGQDLARAAVGVVVARLDGPPDGQDGPSDTVLTPRLVVRGTTAPRLPSG